MGGELAEGEAVGAGGEAEVARGGGGGFRADCEGVGRIVWWTALRAEAVAAEPGGEEVAVSGCVGGGWMGEGVVWCGVRGLHCFYMVKRIRTYAGKERRSSGYGWR